MLSRKHGPEAAAQLAELLRRANGTEHPDIDYKLLISVQSKEEKAEFAKDVALQANLESGGNLVYGVTNDGNIAGLPGVPDVELLNNILCNRLQYTPSGIDLEVVELPALSTGQNVPLLWVRVPPNRYEVLTAFLASDSTWQMPVRVGTSTRYLTPVEAASYRSAQRRGIDTQSALRVRAPEDWGEPDSLTETVATNLLPITRLPRLVWTARCNAEVEGEVRSSCGDALPPFRAFKGNIWSLRSKADCERYFRPILTGGSREVPMDKLLRRRDSRRRVISLVNDEISDYLRSLDLVWDPNRHRAYFSPENGNPREISWQAFKRRATRLVVGKKLLRDGTVHHWFHFGVRLRVEDLKQRFALALSPTWVFTRDGKTLLRSYQVTPIATKKLNREDNARILYNIQFWTQYLARGKKTVDLGLGGGTLSVSTEPLVIRVTKGIIGDQIEVTEVSPGDGSDAPEIEWSQVAEESDEDDDSEGLNQWN